MSRDARRFFIIDDHSLLRRGLAGWLTDNTDWQLAGDACSAESAIGGLHDLAAEGMMPDVVICDVNLGNEDGLALVSRIRQMWPDIPCIVYSMYTAPSVIQLAFAAGASGYVSKQADEHELQKALDAVSAGKTYVEQTLANPLMMFRNSISALTKRETDVLFLSVRGLSNSEIARQLGIDKRAVENYVSRIYAKIGCSNREELTARFGK